jgi:hypothetical protein
MSTRLALASLILALAPVAPRAADPAPPAPEPRGNVRVTIRLGRLENGKRQPMKSYDLVVAPDTAGSKLLSGARVPLPVGDDKAEATEGGRFVYQNIGFSAEAMVWILSDGKIKILGQFEDSRLAEAVAGRPPVVQTRQLSVNAVLTDGQPMEVTRVDGGTDPSGYVEVEAKVLR